MREANQLVGKTLGEVAKLIKPGVTTNELTRVAEEFIRDNGAEPTFKGYPNQDDVPFPAALCTSVNEMVVHGIPNDEPLKEGDIVSIDCGATLKGYVADSAVTVGVGKVGEEAAKLMDATEGSLYEGILKMVPGNHTGDVSAAIQAFAEGRGYYLTKQYTGHGVGRSMWEAPQVPNYGTAGTGLKLKAGITIAIEPMLLIGTEDTKVMKDGWSVSSANRKLTGHFEHSIAVTEDGPMILTLLDNDEPPVVFNPDHKNRVLSKN